MKNLIGLKGGVLTAAISAALVATPLAASGVGEEVLPGMHVVPDGTLAEMRGKYVSSTSKVVYFGVQLSSNWSSQSGALLSAGGSLALDVSSPTPTYSFSSSSSVNPAAADDSVTATDTSNRTISSQGVENVSGITQSIQVAGDDNVLENVTQVSLLDDIPKVEMSGNTGNSEASGSATDGTAFTAGSYLDENGMRVKLAVDGQGESEQTIRSYLQGVGGNGVIQSIRMLGDRQRVSNRMNLDVVMQQETREFMMQQGVGAAINNLRGLKGSM